VGAESESEPPNSDPAQIRRLSFITLLFHQATIDYRRCLTELPAFCNHDDPSRADSGRCPVLRFVPPHQFRVKRRPWQPQCPLNADFVLQPGGCLSLAKQCAEPATRDRSVEIRTRSRWTPSCLSQREIYQGLNYEEAWWNAVGACGAMATMKGHSSKGISSQ
jgi:hypothetical protein